MVLDNKERVMKKIDRIILISLIVGVYGLMVIILIKPFSVYAHADGHTHAAHDVLGIAKEGHTHVYAGVGHSHSIDKIRGLDGQIRLIVSQCNRGIYGAC